jgi:tRNA1(Val) A37 N6-methylase TrmN6
MKEIWMKRNLLKDDERLDYLIKKDIKVIQSPSVFSFSLDAILLGNFAYVPIQKGKIIDLCTGNGAIALLLSKKSKADIIGVEIQERIYDMAVRSIALNNKEEQIKVIKANIKDAPGLLGHGSADIITCNPPYFASENVQDLNMNEHLAIARHEIYCSLEDVIRVCSLLLRHGGKVSIVHRPNRLVEIITLMKHFNLEPKRLQFVYPKEDKEANMILIEGLKGGRPELRVLSPLYVRDHAGNYTQETRNIIEGKN